MATLLSSIANDLKSVVSAPVNRATMNTRGVLQNSINSARQGVLQGLTNAITGRQTSTSSKAEGSASDAGNALQGINARSDAILSFNWYCIPPAVGGKSLMWYYVEAGTLPFRQITTQTVKRRGHYEKIPSEYEIGDLQLTFFLDDSMSSMIYLDAWNNAVLRNKDVLTDSAQGLWGRPAEFYRDIPVHILSVNRKEVLTLTYIEAWPTNIDPLTVASGGSDRHVLDVTFACADVQVKITPTEAFKGSSATPPADGGFLSNAERAISSGLPSSFSNFIR